jgi:hypothetical protein
MPRPRALKPRLDHVEGKRHAAGQKADGHAALRRRLLRLEATMGAVIREALAEAGADLKAASQLAVADDAAAALAAIPDTPELQEADLAAAPPSAAHQRGRADAFAAKITEMSKGYAGGRPLDLANASFAELLAWSLARGSRRVA